MDGEKNILDFYVVVTYMNWLIIGKSTSPSDPTDIENSILYFFSKKKGWLFWESTLLARISKSVLAI